MKYWITEVLIGCGALTFILWFLMFSLSSPYRVRHNGRHRFVGHVTSLFLSLYWLYLVLDPSDLWSRSQGLWGLYVGSTLSILFWKIWAQRSFVKYIIKRELSIHPDSSEVRRWAISNSIEVDGESHDWWISTLNRLRLSSHITRWQHAIYGDTGLSKITLSCAADETDRRTEVFRATLRSPQDSSLLEMRASELAQAYRLEVALTLHVHLANTSDSDPKTDVDEQHIKEREDLEELLNRALVLFDYLGSAWLEHKELIEPALEIFDETVSMLNDRLASGGDLGFKPQELVQCLRDEVRRTAFKKIERSSLIFYELILAIRLIDQRYFRIACARLDQCFNILLKSRKQDSFLPVNQELMEGILKSFVASATLAAQEHTSQREHKNSRQLEADYFGPRGEHYQYTDEGRSPNRSGALPPPKRPLERGVGFGSLLVGIIGFSMLGVFLCASPLSDDVQVLYDVPSDQAKRYSTVSESQTAFYEPLSSLFIADHEQGLHRIDTQTFYLDEERGMPPLGPGGLITGLSTDQERIGALVRPVSTGEVDAYEVAWRDAQGVWRRTFSLSEVTDFEGDDIVALLQGWGPVTLLVKHQQSYSQQSYSQQSYALLAYHEAERILYSPKLSGDLLDGEFISAAHLKTSNQRSLHAIALSSGNEETHKGRGSSPESRLVIAEAPYDGQRLGEVKFYDLGETTGGCVVKSMSPRSSGDDLELQFVCGNGAAWVWSLSRDLSRAKVQRVRSKLQVRGGSQAISDLKASGALITPNKWLWTILNYRWSARPLSPLSSRAPGEGVGWSIGDLTGDPSAPYAFDQRTVHMEVASGELLVSSPKANLLTKLVARGRKITSESLLKDQQTLLDSTRSQSGVFALWRETERKDSTETLKRGVSHIKPDSAAHGLSENVVYQSLTLDSTPHEKLIHRDEPYYAIAPLRRGSADNVIALTKSGLVFGFESATDKLVSINPDLVNDPCEEATDKLDSINPDRVHDPSFTLPILPQRVDSAFSKDARHLMTLTTNGEVHSVEVKQDHESKHTPLVKLGDQPTTSELNQSSGSLTTKHQVTLLSRGSALHFDLRKQERGWRRQAFKNELDSAPLLIPPTPLLSTPHAWAFSRQGEATLLQVDQESTSRWEIFDAPPKSFKALRGAGVEFFTLSNAGWFGFLFTQGENGGRQLSSYSLLPNVGIQTTTGPLTIKDSNLRLNFVDYLSYNHLYTLNKTDRSWSKSTMSIPSDAEFFSCQGESGGFFSSKSPGFLALLSEGNKPLVLNAVHPAEELNSHGSPSLRQTKISPIGIFGLSEGNSVASITPTSSSFKLKLLQSTLDRSMDLTSIAEVIESGGVFWVRGQDQRLAIYSPDAMETTRVKGDTRYTSLHPSGQNIFASSQSTVALFSQGDPEPGYTWSTSQAQTTPIKQAGVAHQQTLPIETDDGSLHLLEVQSSTLQNRTLLKRAKSLPLSSVTASIARDDKLYLYGREGGYVRGDDPLTPFERLTYASFKPREVSLYQGDLWLQSSDAWVRQRDGFKVKGGLGWLNGSTMISARNGKVDRVESKRPLPLFGEAPAGLGSPQGILPLSSGEVWMWSERGSAVFTPAMRSYRTTTGHLNSKAPILTHRDTRGRTMGDAKLEWIIDQGKSIYSLSSQGELSKLFAGQKTEELTFIQGELYGRQRGNLLHSSGRVISHQPLSSQATRVKVISALSHSGHLIRLHSTGEIDAVNLKTLSALSLQAPPSASRDLPTELIGIGGDTGRDTGGGSDPTLIYLKRDGSISALRLTRLSNGYTSGSRDLINRPSDSFVGRGKVITLNQGHDQITQLSLSDLSVSSMSLQGTPWPSEHLELISGSRYLLARIANRTQANPYPQWRLYDPLSAQTIGSAMSGELLFTSSEGIYLIKRSSSKIFPNSLRELRRYDPQTGELLNELRPHHQDESLLYHLHQQGGRERRVTLFRLRQSDRSVELKRISQDLQSEVTLLKYERVIPGQALSLSQKQSESKVQFEAKQIILTDQSKVILLPKLYIKISHDQSLLIGSHDLNLNEQTTSSRSKDLKLKDNLSKSPESNSPESKSPKSKTVRTKNNKPKSAQSKPHLEVKRVGDTLTIKERSSLNSSTSSSSPTSSTSLSLKLKPEEYDPDHGSILLFWRSAPEQQSYKVSEFKGSIKTERGALDLRSGWYLEETVTDVSFRGDQIAVKFAQGEGRSIPIEAPRSKRAIDLFKTDSSGALSLKQGDQEIRLGQPIRGQLPINKRFNQVALTSSGTVMLSDLAGQIWEVDQSRHSHKVDERKYKLVTSSQQHGEFYVHQGALVSRSQHDGSLIDLERRTRGKRSAPLELLSPNFRSRSGEIGSLSWRERARAVEVYWRPQGASQIPVRHTRSGYDLFHSRVVRLTQSGLMINTSGGEIIIPVEDYKLSWARARTYNPRTDRSPKILTEPPRRVSLSQNVSIVTHASSPPRLEMVIDQTRFPFSVRDQKFMCDHITSATALRDQLITVSSGKHLVRWSLNSEGLITSAKVLPSPGSGFRSSERLSLSPSMTPDSITLSLDQRRWELRGDRWRARDPKLHLKIGGSKWSRINDKSFELDQERHTLISGQARFPCEIPKINAQRDLVVTPSQTLKYQSKEGWCELNLRSRALPKVSEAPRNQPVKMSRVNWLKVERFPRRGDRGPKYEIYQGSSVIHRGEFSLPSGGLEPVDEWRDVIITSEDKVYLVTRGAGLHRELSWSGSELLVGPPEAGTHRASSRRCPLQKQIGRYQLSSAHELIRRDSGRRQVNFGRAGRGGLPIYNPELSAPLAWSSTRQLIWSNQGRVLRAQSEAGLDELEELGKTPNLKQRRFTENSLGKYQLALSSNTAARLLDAKTGEFSSEVKLSYPQETLRSKDGLRSNFSRRSRGGDRGVELTLRGDSASSQLELHLYASGQRATFEHLAGTYLMSREDGFAVHGPKWTSLYQRTKSRSKTESQSSDSVRLVSVTPSGPAATPPSSSPLSSGASGADSDGLIVKREQASGAQRYRLQWKGVDWSPVSFTDPVRIFVPDVNSKENPSILEVGDDWWRVRELSLDSSSSRITRRSRGEPFAGWRSAYLSEKGLTVNQDTIQIKSTGEVDRQLGNAPAVGSLAPKTVGPWVISLARSSSPLQIKYQGRALRLFDGALDIDMALFTTSHQGLTWLIDRHGVSQYNQESERRSWSSHQDDVNTHLQQATPTQIKYESKSHIPLYTQSPSSTLLTLSGSSQTLSSLPKWQLKERLHSNHNNNNHSNLITEYTETKHLLLEWGDDQLRVERRQKQVFSYPPLKLNRLLKRGRFFFDDPISIYQTPSTPRDGGSEERASRFVIGMRGGSYELVSFRGEQIEIGDIVLTPPRHSSLRATHARPDLLTQELTPDHHAQIREELGAPWLWLMLRDRAFILGNLSSGWFERGR